MEKNKVSAPHLFLFSIVAQFYVKLAKKMEALFTILFCGSWVKSSIKLWHRQIRSGKKNETDGTRQKNVKKPPFFRQFHVKLATKKMRFPAKTNQ